MSTQSPLIDVDTQKKVIIHEFNSQFYLSQFSHNCIEVDETISHYLNIGWREGKDPSPDFSTTLYLEHNPDVRESGINPFVHYIGWGREEGRLPKPVPDHLQPRPAPDHNGFDQNLAWERKLVEHAFDVDHYLEKSPDLQGAPIDPILHYLEHGWREGRDPSPDFSTTLYLEHNPDVRESGTNPFVHYIGWGGEEGRLPKPAPEPRPAPDHNGFDQNLAWERKLVEHAFDVDYYLEKSPDLQGAPIDPILHYLEHGWREGRDPSPDFSTTLYLEHNPDARESGINPFVHYIGWGREEGRLPKPAPDHLQPRPAPDHNGFDENLTWERKLVEHAFDVGYYLEKSPDLQGAPIDPILHYLEHGWREGRDPSPDFSTIHYLDSNPDIKAGGGNPFVHYVSHGRREGRSGLPYQLRKQRMRYKPLVSAIVPNYNHARFLTQRLDSILTQTWPYVEIIVLDDYSADESVSIIEEYSRANPARVKTLFNKENSGSVFSQWKKGISHASGELLWICESDDFCEIDLLERLAPFFADPSVMIAFGRIQFADAESRRVEGLDTYREQTEAGIWSNVLIRTAHDWFRGAFGLANIIPNVGGCLLRNQPIPEEIWTETEKFRICGDWFLYAMLARGGRIAYSPHAVAYFRQHGRNTSVTGSISSTYYREHKHIITALRERWGTTDDIVATFYRNVFIHYKHVNARKHVEALSDLFSLDNVLKTKRSSKHIMIAFLGFHLGGGELFPIHLANELVRRGYIVSVMTLDPNNEDSGVRAMLDPSVPVYEAQLLEDIGIHRFVESIGVDLIHSHTIGCEYFFFQKHNLILNIPYVITLHGSYEVTLIPDDLLLKIIRRVSHWIYLAKKNLAHLSGMPIKDEVISHIANGMPLDTRDFARTRQQLGIADSDIVFVLASRAIREKGWRIAIQALVQASKKTQRKLVLLLCGSGPDLEDVKREYEGTAGVLFLGFQDKIHGLYRMSNCALLPSRFQGESFPLTLIQAMQVGVPIIATDIGQIGSMIVRDGLQAGIMIFASDDDAVFVASLADAMLTMVDDRERSARAADAMRLGSAYDMSGVAKRYAEVYEAEIGKLPLRE